MYYVLEDDNSVRKVRHLNYSGGDGWGIDFMRGNELPAPGSPDQLYAHFECNRLDLPEFFEVSGVPVATEKLIHALESANANFQAFPIHLEFEDAKVHGYFVFNIVGRIRAIDKEATRCRMFGPSIARLFDLKLNVEATEGRSAFRDASYQDIIFIDDRVKSAIEEQQIQGCAIRAADGWSDAHRF
ncbi:MAG: hypothetical protein KDK33_09180 [Leptospiraceae bacterium]|nr:hypothetical protein [Leptospiraceae bacterium]